MNAPVPTPAVNGPPDAIAERLQAVFDAHGGTVRWQAVERIEARLSSGGLAFISKFQASALKGLRATVWPHEPRVELGGFGQPGGRGLWTPDEVQLVDAAGTVVARRSQPRAALFTWPKRLGWDRLDILYFAGYALWNYLSFPLLLALPGVRVTGVEPGRPEGVQMLRAAFGPQVPTHSALQTFHVDAAGLLLRHDYTADVIGSWATAANRCLASEVVDGLRFYTRRLVTPRFGDHLVLPGPTLVWIELDDIRVHGRGGAQA